MLPPSVSREIEQFRRDQESFGVLTERIDVRARRIASRKGVRGKDFGSMEIVSRNKTESWKFNTDAERKKRRAKKMGSKKKRRRKKRKVPLPCVGNLLSTDLM